MANRRLLPFARASAGLIGNGLSKLFGDPKSVSVPSLLPQSTMTVNAGIVYVNSASVTGGIGSVLGANPATGSPLGGAGSGALGFGLSGPQSSGSQQPTNGLGSFGFGPNGTSTGAGLNAASQALLARLNPAQREVADYVIGSARRNNVDENVALRIVQQESGFNRLAHNPNRATGDDSYGPMQLNMLGGMGVEAQRAGIDVRNPGVSWRENIDYGMGRAARGGWGPWGASRDLGIGKWEGIRRQGAELDPAAQSLEQTTESASKSVADLSQSVGQLPDAASSATSSLSSFASSLFNFKPSSDGGGFNIGGLFGFGGGNVGETVTMSAMGNVMTSRGPVRLNRYARGGVANQPQVAVFGEGSTPEAYVPLPDGRAIPVAFKEPPANDNRNRSGSYVDRSSRTYHLPPARDGVTPEQMVSAIRAYDKELDRTAAKKVANYQRNHL